MQAYLYVKPVPIWEFLDKVTKALKQALPDRVVNDIQIHTQFGTDTANMRCTAAEAPTNASLKEKIKNYKEREYLEPQSIRVNIQNQWQIGYFLSDDRDRNDKRGPVLRLDFHDSYRDVAPEMALIDSLNRHFTIIPATQAAAISISDAQLASFRFAENVVATLASETAKISQASVRGFEEFILGVKQRTLELEQDFQTKSNELETRVQQREAQLQAEYKSKLSDIEVREKAHAEAVKQFELRNNTAVRRDLLKEIRLKIEEQKTIQISSGTIQKRRIIHAVCLFTLLLSATIVGLLAFKIFAQTVDWRLLIPMSTSTMVFVMTGIYYIKWNDQWFRDHARVEFETRKFSADILRASWIAELFFEWAEKKGINMPPELVGSFTKNLFDGTVTDGRLHPTDQLADLLKQVSSLEVTKGGIKMTKREDKS